MKNGNVQEMTTGKFSEFSSAVVSCLPRGGFDPQKFINIDGREELRNLLKNAFVSKIEASNAEDETSIKKWWEKFYYKYFSLKVDLSNVEIPPYQEGFDWIIIIAGGLSLKQVIKALRKVMKVRLYKDNLSDKDVPTNDRHPSDGAYAVRFRKRAEADEEMKDKSANILKNDMVTGITLIERLIMELAYFEETNGQHLDISNWTLCSGSRNSDGGVPHVNWYSGDGELCVYWTPTGSAVDDLRCRVAVSKTRC